MIFSEGWLLPIIFAFIGIAMLVPGLWYTKGRYVLTDKHNTGVALATIGIICLLAACVLGAAVSLKPDLTIDDLL
ncbi:MAG: hypothetical protein WC505_02490 [Patescibacteria group bacterium]